MHFSSQGAELVAAWEGLPDGDHSTVNLDPYMDPVGIWTIGYGRALRGKDGQYLKGPSKRAEAFGQYPGGITPAKAKDMLREDLDKISGEVTTLAGAATNQNQFDALLSFHFNTGALAASTLLKLHKRAVGAGSKLSDAEIKTLFAQVRGKTLGTPATIPQAFAAYSFASKAFLGGLFCRRLAEARLYAGDTAAAANAYGAHVRTVIA